MMSIYFVFLSLLTAVTLLVNATDKLEQEDAHGLNLLFL